MLWGITNKENVLNWLGYGKEKVIENTIRPEVIEAYEKTQGFFSIDWGGMITQVLLMGCLGFCCYLLINAIGERPIGQMVLLVTVVSCIRFIVISITG